jgi:branched-chain amino acid transport system permease protein
VSAILLPEHEGHDVTAATAVLPPQTPATSVVSGRGALLWVRLALLAVVCGAVVAIGSSADPTVRYGLILGVVYAIAILGGNAITGLLGEINLAQGAFMAAGAYVSVVCLDRGWPLWQALVVSVLSTAAIGAVLAVPTVRLEGIFTALVTFALAFAVPDLIIQFREVTGGHTGLPVPFGLSLFGLTAGGSDASWLTAVVILFGLGALVTLLIIHSQIGRVLVTIGEGGPAAECFGVRSRAWEVAVWSWAAGLAALAGGCFALTIGYLTPEVFPVMLSIMLLVGTVVGGARSALGALIGGILIGTVPPQLQSVIPAEATGILFGAVLLLSLLAGRGGVNGFLERAIAFLWSRAARNRKGALR